MASLCDVCDEDPPSPPTPLKLRDVKKTAAAQSFAGHFSAMLFMRHFSSGQMVVHVEFWQQTAGGLPYGFICCTLLLMRERQGMLTVLDLAPAHAVGLVGTA